jgi:hypothetical protein
MIHRNEPFPFVTTLHVLKSAILKMARLQPTEKVYRGTKGGILPAEFWTPNESNVRGGIEMAFMSTTLDRSVVSSFAAAEGKPSLLFDIQMGMVDRGVAVQWCSQFPGEAEILFAPLNGLEVVGEPTMYNATIVVSLRLNCNLHELTIEEVTAKMYNSHLGVLHIIEAELQQLRFPPESLKRIEEHRERMRGHGGQ